MMHEQVETQGHRLCRPDRGKPVQALMSVEKRRGASLGTWTTHRWYPEIGFYKLTGQALAPMASASGFISSRRAELAVKDNSSIVGAVENRSSLARWLRVLTLGAFHA